MREFVSSPASRRSWIRGGDVGNIAASHRHNDYVGGRGGNHANRHGPWARRRRCCGRTEGFQRSWLHGWVKPSPRVKTQALTQRQRRWQAVTEELAQAHKCRVEREERTERTVSHGDLSMPVEGM